MTCIYKISSIVKSERCYIGSAVNYESRKAVHLSQLIKGNHHSKKLQRHFNKYGVSDIIFSVLKITDKINLIKDEQYYIDTIKPYFNSRPNANSNLGMRFGKMKKEHKEKISKALIGRRNLKAAAKLSVPVSKYDLNGNLVKQYKSLSEAIKQEGLKIKTYSSTNKTIGGFVWVNTKMPLPNFKAISQELSNWRKEKMKPVLQMTKEGDIINFYEGVRVASKETGIDHRSIQSVAAGSNPNRKTAGGYYWKYKEVVK